MTELIVSARGKCYGLLCDPYGNEVSCLFERNVFSIFLPIIFIVLICVCGWLYGGIMALISK